MDEKVRSIIQLVALLEGKPVMLKAGEVLFEQGQSGTQMFVVQSGALELKVNGNVVGAAGPGDVIGEMAIVDRQPRSATAVATTDTALFPIDAPQFDKLVQNVPGFAREVIGILVRRLRRSAPSPTPKTRS
jgi:CRP-like cAMP-binding protein